MHIRTNLKKFFKGFTYAGKGLLYCVRTQRNMRFHVGFAVLVLMLALICGVSTTESCLLFISIGGVFALECINTAIESAVDLITDGRRHKLAGIAKDCAAGAVLVFCIFTVCTGAAIFFSKERIDIILRYFKDKPYSAVLTGIFIVLWIIWVLTADAKENKKDK